MPGTARIAAMLLDELEDGSTVTLSCEEPGMRELAFRYETSRVGAARQARAFFTRKRVIVTARLIPPPLRA